MSRGQIHQEDKEARRVKRIKVSHYLSPEVARRLRLMAAELDVSRSDVIEGALRSYRKEQYNQLEKSLRRVSGSTQN